MHDERCESTTVYGIFTTSQAAKEACKKEANIHNWFSAEIKKVLINPSKLDQDYLYMNGEEKID